MPARDLHWRILLGIGATALALDLEGIKDHVYLQLVPDDSTGYSVAQGKDVPVVFPALLFSLDTEAERGAVSDTGTSGWILPIRCWVADTTNPRAHGRLPLYLGARKGLFDAFDEPAGRPKLRDATGQAIEEVINVKVRPQAIFDPRLPQYQYLLSGMVIEVETEEER
jgi:hypothetical protein